MENAAPVKHNKHRILLILLVFLAILIVLVSIPACMVFSRKPMELDKQELNPLLAVTLAVKAQKSWASLKNASPMKIDTLQYTDQEFNYLITGMLKGAGFTVKKQSGGLDLNRISLSLHNGIFQLKYIKEIPGNPYGRYLNTVIRFKAEYRDGKEKIEVTEAYAGTMKLSADMVDGKVQELIQTYYRNSPYEASIRNALITFTAKDQKVLLVYKPYYVVRDVDQFCFNGSGQFIRMMTDEKK